MKTGTHPHINRFRTLFCGAIYYLRGEGQEPSKLALRAAEGIHLGIDQRLTTPYNAVQRRTTPRRLLRLSV
eukprot:4164681-Pleurochrysis_carterae.AAC.3